MNPKRVSSPFLFSGIAYCGHCGKALVGTRAKNGKFPYYVCGTLNKKGSSACPAKRTVNEDVDSSMQSFDDELTLISDSIEETTQRLGRLYDAIETGKLDLDDIALRIRELKTRQDQLQAKRIEIESQISDRKVDLADIENLMSYVDDLRDLLTEGSPAEQKVVLKGFVKEIRVTGDEVALTYSMPAQPDTPSIGEEGVLRTVQSGGRYWSRTFSLNFHIRMEWQTFRYLSSDN